VEGKEGLQKGPRGFAKALKEIPFFKQQVFFIQGKLGFFRRKIL